MTMILQQKRPAWLLLPRIDSRLLLKALIAFNIFLAVYHVFTLQNGHQKNTPCIVVINTSNNNNNNAAKTTADDTFNDRITSFQRDPWDTPKLDAKSYLEGAAATDSPITTTAPLPAVPWWSTERRGSYSVINSYVIADSQVGYNESVTLTTQGSFEFLYHAEKLCQRWDGPISVAVYAPGDDFKVSLQLIYFLRTCRDSCVRRNVSWHFIYDTMFGPPITNVSYPEPIGTSNFNLLNCSITNEELPMHFKSTFKTDHKLPYPINVVRNVARIQSKTRYVLASDIELYPSINVVSMFNELLERERNNLVPLVKKDIPHVYVLPIFEVKAGLQPPLTKLELIDMIKQGNAIFFHKWVCDSCQNFPDRNLWAELAPQNNSLNIFRSTKRLRNRNAWEPLYIGTNDEPLYDERLTWDGKRDKMSQMYEMCLLNYDILILDAAFLVHSPGIKHIDAKDQQRRLKYIKRNNSVYNTIIAKLRKKYGNSSKC